MGKVIPSTSVRFLQKIFPFLKQMGEGYEVFAVSFVIP